MHNKLFLACFVWCIGGVSTSNQIAKHVTLLNKSGAKLQIFWVDPSGKQIPFIDVYNGAQKGFSSFINHTFVVRQMDLASEQSRIGYLTICDRENEVVLINEDMQIKRKEELYNEANMTSEGDQTSFVQGCMDKVAVSLDQKADDLIACVEGRLISILEQKNEEISFEKKTVKRIGGMLENYTCLDAELPTTEGKVMRKWEYNDTFYDVSVLHERPDSQVHLIRNFITGEECDAFQEAASRLLHRGTVADGLGGSRLSENRKAWQAGVAVPWEKESEGDFLARYTRRMYLYANHATGFDMDVKGQEDIMSIQYFGEDGDHPQGSSYTPETPDRYTPHCDGNCDGLPHRRGARVATMVAYCTIPSKGGATNFQNVGAHVKPEFGAGVFFSYMNPHSNVMDTGWTTHSGCPVIEGSKRIVVHWMRVGVSAEEPWDSFNTLNIPKGEVKN